MPVKVWVGRFAIVDGQPQEEGPLLRSFPRQRPDEEEDELYVLVEPVAEGNKEYYGQLVDAIGRMYQQDTLSITGAVLRAMQAAHRQLRDWNDRTLREQRVAAGTTCLAVRGRTAYLAQIGPTVAYHVGDGRFERVKPEAAATEPLGVAEQAEPTFNRYELAPGDLLLVASTSIDQFLDEELLRSIVLRGGDDALVELFRIARDQPNFSLVLLACVVEPDDERGDQDVPAVALAPAGLVEGSEPAATIPDVPSAGPVLSPETPADAGIPVFGGAVAAHEPSPPSEADLVNPPAALTQPKVRLKGSDATVDYRRSTGLSSRIPSISPIAVASALILIIVGLLAWQIIPRALEDSKEERFESSVASAEASLAAAQAATDPEEKRQHLDDAKSELERAEDYKPGDARVQELNSQVEAELNELNAVLVLPELEQVVDLSGRVAQPFSSRDLAIGGGGAYFLDRDQGRVIGIALTAPDPEPFVMYQEGDLIGTEISGKAHSMAWAEQLGALLVIDEQRRLVAITPPNASEELVVRDADAWGSEDGIGYFEASLYVLDRGNDQVWLYPSTETGFDSEREGLLPTFDLENAIEMAAADPLYLLFSDSSIVRFSDGVAQPFSQAGLDRPMSSPGSIIPLTDGSAVLVADSGNARVVEFASDGAFRQQLVSPTFTDLRSIAVDEQARLLYILNGSALYRTPLPPMP